MDFRDLPPLVSRQEIGQLERELESVTSGDGFVLFIEPLVDPSIQEPDAEMIEERVTFLLRIAAHASYSLGRRIVKIADLGHEWPGFGPRTEAYVRTSSLAHYLSVLSCGGFASLARVRDWGTPHGSGVPETYLQSISGIEQVSKFSQAFGLSFGAQFEKLDLWMSYSTNMDSNADLLMSKNSKSDGDRYCGMGHLLRLRPSVADDAAPKTWEMLNFANPKAVLVTDEASEEFAFQITEHRAELSKRSPLLIGAEPTAINDNVMLRSRIESENAVWLATLDVGRSEPIDDWKSAIVQQTEKPKGLWVLMPKGSITNADLALAIGAIDAISSHVNSKS